MLWHKLQHKKDQVACFFLKSLLADLRAEEITEASWSRRFQTFVAMTAMELMPAVAQPVFRVCLTFQCSHI